MTSGEMTQLQLQLAMEITKMTKILEPDRSTLTTLSTLTTTSPTLTTTSPTLYTLTAMSTAADDLRCSVTPSLLLHQILKIHFMMRQTEHVENYVKNKLAKNKT